MPQTTNIAWTDSTWNPWSGCIKVSPGCDNCYASTLAENKRGTAAFPNGFDLTLRPHKYADPLKWKEPRRIFVNSMSDFFLGTVPPEAVVAAWNTMLAADWHQFQILTKRPIPAKRIIKELGLELPPHIWLGVSVENQEMADLRIPTLLEIPAKVRFLSCEPLLGPIDLSLWLGEVNYCQTDLTTQESVSAFQSIIRAAKRHIGMPVIDWVIDGGESGPGRRPADTDWFRSIRDQCQAAGVAYFHKQGNAFKPGMDRELDGRTWEETP